MSGLQLVAGPSVEPLTLAVVKAHLRIDHIADDALLGDLVPAVRQLAELYTGRAFITQTLRLWCDAAPAGNTLKLPRPPLLAVMAVRSYADDGTASLMPASLYLADNVAHRLVLREGASWPAFTRRANGLEVEYQAGYGPAASDVPLALRQGMLAHLAHLYEHRGDGVVSDNTSPESALPQQALALYAPYRLFRGVT